MEKNKNVTYDSIRSTPHCIATTGPGQLSDRGDVLGGHANAADLDELIVDISKSETRTGLFDLLKPLNKATSIQLVSRIVASITSTSSTAAPRPTVPTADHEKRLDSVYLLIFSVSGHRIGREVAANVLHSCIELISDPHKRVSILYRVLKLLTKILLSYGEALKLPLDTSRRLAFKAHGIIKRIPIGETHSLLYSVRILNWLAKYSSKTNRIRIFESFQIKDFCPFIDGTIDNIDSSRSALVFSSIMLIDRLLQIGCSPNDRLFSLVHSRFVECVQQLPARPLESLLKIDVLPFLRSSLSIIFLNIDKDQCKLTAILKLNSIVRSLIGLETICTEKMGNRSQTGNIQDLSVLLQFIFQIFAHFYRSESCDESIRENIIFDTCLLINDAIPLLGHHRSGIEQPLEISESFEINSYSITFFRPLLLHTILSLLQKYISTTHLFLDLFILNNVNTFIQKTILLTSSKVYMNQYKITELQRTQCKLLYTISNYDTTMIPLFGKRLIEICSQTREVFPYWNVLSNMSTSSVHSQIWLDFIFSLSILPSDNPTFLTVYIKILKNCLSTSTLRSLYKDRMFILCQTFVSVTECSVKEDFARMLSIYARDTSFWEECFTDTILQWLLSSDAGKERVMNALCSPSLRNTFFSRAWMSHVFYSLTDTAVLTLCKRMFCDGDENYLCIIQEVGLAQIFHALVTKNDKKVLDDARKIISGCLAFRKCLENAYMYANAHLNGDARDALVLCEKGTLGICFCLSNMERISISGKKNTRDVVRMAIDYVKVSENDAWYSKRKECAGKCLEYLTFTSNWQTIENDTTILDTVFRRALRFIIVPGHQTITLTTAEETTIFPLDVLANISPVFKAIVQGTFIEAETKHIVIFGSSDTLNLLLQYALYVYSRTLLLDMGDVSFIYAQEFTNEGDISILQVLELWKMADMYIVDGLKTLIIGWLGSKIRNRSFEECLQAIKFIYMEEIFADFEIVLRVCFWVIGGNWLQMSRTDEWVAFQELIIDLNIDLHELISVYLG